MAMPVYNICFYIYDHIYIEYHIYIIYINM